MTPIRTKHTNVVYGKSQEEYQPLPAHEDNVGTITTCWELTEEDLKEVIANRRVYLQQYTFNQPMQPIRLSVDDPLEITEET